MTRREKITALRSQIQVTQEQKGSRELEREELELVTDLLEKKKQEEDREETDLQGFNSTSTELPPHPWLPSLLFSLLLFSFLLLVPRSGWAFCKKPLQLVTILPKKIL